MTENKKTYEVEQTNERDNNNRNVDLARNWLSSPHFTLSSEL